MKYPRNPLLRTPRLALAFASLFALPCLAVDPAAVLPDESVAYIEMDSQAIYKLVDHPVVKTLPLADLEKLLLKMTDSSLEEAAAIEKRIAEATGIPYEELEKKFGRFAASIHDLKIPDDPTPENVGGEVSLAQEFDGDEALMQKFVEAMLTEILAQAEKQAGKEAEEMKEFFSKAKEMTEHSIVEHGGAKIHILKLKETEETKEAPAFVREWAYAVHDKMILASSGQDGVEEMLDRMKSGANTGSLAASAYYKKDHEKAGPTLGMASLNLQTVLGLVEKHALPLADSSEIDAKKVWTALGADKLQSAVIAAGAAADTFDLALLLNYSEKPGLFGVFAVPGPGTPPAFLPKSLAAASYQQLDFDKTLDNAIKLAAQIYPPAEMVVETALTAAKGQVGVDIRKELLAQLGPDIWVASRYDEKDEAKSPPIGGQEAMLLGLMGLNGLNGVYGIKVKDSKAFALALDSIINKVASREAIFETREYQGFTIHNAKGVPDPMKIGYVLTDEWLILSMGGQEVLEQILGRLGKSEEDGFFAQKAIAKTLDGLRGGQMSTSAGDVGANAKAMCDMFGSMFKQAGEDAPGIPFDELGKLLNVPLIMVDKTWIEDSHLEYRLRVAPKGE
jgi:hypothetical protein